MGVEFLRSPQGRRLAYHRLDGTGPTVVFCGGLKSDMEGTKALHLESWARTHGQAFLRFDYSGHGQSSGIFENSCIGDWHDDMLAVVDGLTDGPLVVVGSSMGGWLALLTARARPGRMAGLVTIAAAPDFTEDGWWAGLSAGQRTELETTGRTTLPSDYMDPFTVTRRMIEDGRRHLLLRDPLHLPVPTRFLQGTNDTAVSMETALRLFGHATGPNIQLTLAKGADHRFSDPDCLRIIETAITGILHGV